VSETNDKGLVPVVIDGWTLFTGDGGAWVMDRHLADQAELGNKGDIKNTILGVIADGIASVTGPAAAQAAARAAERPSRHEPHGIGSTDAVIHAEMTVVPAGARGSQEVLTFYLNREAALHVLMRLRTLKAVKLQIAVVKVFLAVGRGDLGDIDVPALCHRVADLEIHNGLLEQHVAVLMARLDLFDPSSTGIIGKPRADMIRNLLLHVARTQCLVAGEADAQGMIEPKAQTRRLKEQDNALRRILGFVVDIGQGWESLPLLKFGDAMSHLQALRARAEKDMARVKAAVDAKSAQLALHIAPKPKRGLRAIKGGAT